jgi:hypothetical protein
VGRDSHLGLPDCGGLLEIRGLKLEAVLEVSVLYGMSYTVVTREDINVENYLKKF